MKLDDSAFLLTYLLGWVSSSFTNFCYTCEHKAISPKSATLNICQVCHLYSQPINTETIKCPLQARQATNTAVPQSEYPMYVNFPYNYKDTSNNAAFIASGKYGVSHFQVPSFPIHKWSVFMRIFLQTRQQNGGQNYVAFSGRIFAKK